MQSQNQAINDVFNLCDEVVENISEFGETASRWPSGMSYGYDNGCLVLVAHISIGRLQYKPHDFCATFYRVPPEVDLLRDYDRSVVWHREAKFSADDIGDNNIEQPVLVRIVEVGEQAKQGREKWVRSIVRLRSLDYCLRSRVKERDPVLLSGVVVRSTYDRELEFLPIRRGIPSSVSDGEPVNDVVKGGPEIMNTVSRNERPSFERGSTNDVNDSAVAFTLGVTLMGDDIRLSLGPCLDFNLKSLDVFFGAAELQETASEFRTDHAVYCTATRSGVSS